MKKIIAIIGARPQFIKHAPIELAARGVFEMVTIHTGQHYDYKMSQVFFDELNISKPSYNLQVGSGTHGVQTGKMLIELEPIMLKENPDYVLVYGDTNSTLAGSLVASKLNIPIIHIEAGLRSFNKEMPEEINRILTDHVSSLLFVPTVTGINNLANEGISKNVHLIGDVMYDMIKICESRKILDDNSDVLGKYYFATIHRPYNTDSKERMIKLIEVFQSLSLPVKFAIHPRTLNIISEYLDISSYSNIDFLEPLSYFDTVKSIYNSKTVITDSGGVQKEAYMLKKKCITIRSETEWVETLNNGWNTLVFENLDQLLSMEESLPGEYVDGLYGNGDAAKQVIDIIKSSEL